MGLDMYLEKYPHMNGLTPKQFNAIDSFVSWIKSGKGCSYTEWCGYDEQVLPSTPILLKALEMIHTSYYKWDSEKKFPRESTYENVGYWRKANAIHKWFVENVQDGEDDCEFHRPVTKDDLEALFELCREVLADNSKANELLPNTSGFFFGSQQYDVWYFEDIKKTAELCKQLIDGFDFENYDLYYRSSW